jgi:hypothetical protein
MSNISAKFAFAILVVLASLPLHLRDTEAWRPRAKHANDDRVWRGAEMLPRQPCYRTRA